MWKKFPKKIKNEIKRKGVSIIKHGDSKLRQRQYEYPITYQLIKDGRANKVLSKTINLKINITMFHGQKDEGSTRFFFQEKFCLFFQMQKRI